MSVQVRYFAAASSAAEREEDTCEPASLDEVIVILGERYGERMQKVLAASSFLIDGVSTVDRRAEVRSGQTLDVLPPFAGG